MAQVRHSTASGRLDELWDYNRLERRVEATVKRGAQSTALSIAICSPRAPHLGAHPIVRIDGETWCVLPVRFVRCWPHRTEVLAAIDCPIGDELACGEQLLLLNTPPHVDAELEAL